MNPTLKALQAATKAKIPTVLVGSPGTGKTAVINEMAKDMGYDLISLVGSRLEPTEVGGMPKADSIVTEFGPVDATVWLAPDWQVEILQKKRVVLFLDEISNASNAVQAALLTILQDHKFANGQAFPDETIVVGAMNPTDEAADGYGISLPLMNRIMWLNWSPTIQEWVDGMKTNWGSPTSEDEMRWKKKIARFIEDNPGSLHRLPVDEGTPQVYASLDTNDSSAMSVYENAWPSRRSWDNLSKVLAESPEDIFVQDMIGQGLVGFAAMTEFREWLRKNDAISPQEVIDNPKSVNWEALSLDDATLIFRSIIEMITPENSGKVIEVLDVVADAGRANLAGPYLPEIIKVVVSDKMGFDVAAENRSRLSVVSVKYSDIAKNSKMKR